MIGESSALLARAGAVSTTLGAVCQALGKLLTAIARAGSGEPSDGDLRQAAHQLISLGGDLTSFGVEIAGKADELS